MAGSSLHMVSSGHRESVSSVPGPEFPREEMHDQRGQKDQTWCRATSIISWHLLEEDAGGP